MATVLWRYILYYYNLIKYNILLDCITLSIINYIRYRGVTAWAKMTQKREFPIAQEDILYFEIVIANSFFNHNLLYFPCLSTHPRSLTDYYALIVHTHKYKQGQQRSTRVKKKCIIYSQSTNHRSSRSLRVTCFSQWYTQLHTEIWISNCQTLLNYCT